MGRTYYISDLVNQGLSMAVYGNLQQSMVIYGNLPVPITLPSIITTYTVIARMEGKRSAYMDFRIV